MDEPTGQKQPESPLELVTRTKANFASIVEDLMPAIIEVESVATLIESLETGAGEFENYAKDVIIAIMRDTTYHGRRIASIIGNMMIVEQADEETFLQAEEDPNQIILAATTTSEEAREMKLAHIQRLNIVGQQYRELAGILFEVDNLGNNLVRLIDTARFRDSNILLEEGKISAGQFEDRVRQIIETAERSNLPFDTLEQVLKSHNKL